MPYNPGVVDRSGEILAQSRLSAGNALLQGLTGGIETYRKNRLQNQILTGENDALLAGLQQLQGMGGAAIDNLAPAGMSKLIEKHTKGGGLGLNESMQLNAMLNTTLKTAQAGQQMQAQQLNQQIAAQQLQNEIMAGRQAQQDSAGLVNALKELASLEAPSQKDVIGIISRQNLSPKAMGQFTELVGRTAPKEIKPATGAEADVQALVSEFSAVNGRPPNATEYRMMRQSVNAERKPSNVTNIGSGFAGQLFTDLNKKKSDLFALREVLANYDTAIDEVSKNGLFAGPGGELKFQGARALQSFGIDAYKTEAEAYQAAGSALANSTLSMARMLPGAFTENELIFLNDVVRGRERVPSLAALKQLRARFESRLQRQQKILDSEVTAFGEGAKDDPNIAIGYRILTAKPSADMPSLPPNF